MLALPSELTHHQASACVLQLQRGITASASPVVIEAGALERFDSSALAVLLQCRRQALSQGKEFAVQGMPQALQRLAQMYGVVSLWEK